MRNEDETYKNKSNEFSVLNRWKFNEMNSMNLNEKYSKLSFLQGFTPTL